MFEVDDNLLLIYALVFAQNLEVPIILVRRRRHRVSPTSVDAASIVAHREVLRDCVRAYLVTRHAAAFKVSPLTPASEMSTSAFVSISSCLSYFYSYLEILMGKFSNEIIALRAELF